MLYVRGDDLSRPIGSDKVRELISKYEVPILSWRKRTARRQPRHTFYSPNLPKSQLQKTPHS